MKAQLISQDIKQRSVWIVDGDGNRFAVHVEGSCRHHEVPALGLRPATVWKARTIREWIAGAANGLVKLTGSK
jgi:hypothetical protein